MQERTNTKAKLLVGIAVIVAIALIYVFSMNKSKGAADTSSVTDSPLATTAPSTSSSSNTTVSSFKTGTYSASGSYSTPETLETITVNLTLAGDGTVTDSAIQQTPQDRESVAYQADFKNNYKPLVVGKKIADIKLDRVSGSSLTSIGFNEALNDIIKQAQ